MHFSCQRYDTAQRGMVNCPLQEYCQILSGLLALNTVMLFSILNDTSHKASSQFSDVVAAHSKNNNLLSSVSSQTYLCFQTGTNGAAHDVKPLKDGQYNILKAKFIFEA